MLEAQIELLQRNCCRFPVVSAAHAWRRSLYQLACQLAELVMRYPVLTHDLQTQTGRDVKSLVQILFLA